MGVKIVAEDAVGPWHSKVVPPVTRGLRAWFTFDTDSSRFKFNRAIGGSDAVMVGNPTAFTTHGRFKGLTNYLQTPIEETDEQTIIVVGKAVVAPTGTADGAFYAGNYTGNSKTPGFTGNAFGASLYHQSATTQTGGSGRDNGAGGITSGQISLNAAPLNWAIRAMRAKSLVPTDNYNLTLGTKATGTSSTARVLADSNHRIGSSNSVFAGEVDISCVAIYASYLTEGEIAQVAAVMRKRMERLGIIV